MCRRASSYREKSLCVCQHVDVPIQFRAAAAADAARWVIMEGEGICQRRENSEEMVTSTVLTLEQCLMDLIHVQPRF